MISVTNFTDINRISHISWQIWMKCGAVSVDLHWKKPNRSEIRATRCSENCTDLTVSMTFVRSFSTFRPFGYSCTQLSLSVSTKHQSLPTTVHQFAMHIFHIYFSVIWVQNPALVMYTPCMLLQERRTFYEREWNYLYACVMTQWFSGSATSQFASHSCVITERKLVYCAVRTASTSPCQCHSTTFTFIACCSYRAKPRILPKSKALKIWEQWIEK